MTLHRKSESYTMTASGETSGAAISSAISGVRTGSGGTHIVVLGVKHTLDGRWEAMVMVVVEPDLVESLLEGRLHKQHDDEDYKKMHPEEEKQEKINKTAYYIEDPALKNLHVYLSTEDYNELFHQLDPIKREFDNKYEEDLHFYAIEKDSDLWTNVQEMALNDVFHLAALPNNTEQKPLTGGGLISPLNLDLEPKGQYRKNELI